MSNTTKKQKGWASTDAGFTMMPSHFLELSRTTRKDGAGKSVKVLTHNDLLLLLTFCELADNFSGEFEHSLSYISKYCGIKEDSILSALNKFEELQILLRRPSKANPISLKKPVNRYKLFANPCDFDANYFGDVVAEIQPTPDELAQIRAEWAAESESESDSDFAGFFECPVEPEPEPEPEPVPPPPSIFAEISLDDVAQISKILTKDGKASLAGIVEKLHLNSAQDARLIPEGFHRTLNHLLQNCIPPHRLDPFRVGCAVRVLSDF